MTFVRKELIKQKAKSIAMGRHCSFQKMKAKSITLVIAKKNNLSPACLKLPAEMMATDFTSDQSSLRENGDHTMTPWSSNTCRDYHNRCKKNLIQWWTD